MPTEEQVLVIPTVRFLAAGYFHGFKPADEALRAVLLDPVGFEFHRRSDVEGDPGFKQLIPYVILRCDGGLFHYRRGSAGTEKRLQAKRSIGIGGHISADDARGGADPYRTGFLREVDEEVAIECKWTERFLGFINDDRTPVGSVHLGIVHLFELEAAAVRPREDSLADAGFAPLAELVGQAEEFETWSQFVLAELEGDS